MPGAWQLEATAAAFLAVTRVILLASRHWFGDTELQLFYRDSQGEAGTATAAQRKSFIGFSPSLLLGTGGRPGDWVTLRQRPLWPGGPQTKIGDSDNALTSGYGEQPRRAPRLGLRSDRHRLRPQRSRRPVGEQLRALRAALSSSWLPCAEGRMAPQRRPLTRRKTARGRFSCTGWISSGRIITPLPLTAPVVTMGSAWLVAELDDI